MFSSLGNISEESLKNLLTQLLMSGMSVTQENQSTDYRRLQEELLRNSQDIRGADRATSNFLSRDSRENNNQYRNRSGFGHERDYRDERRDNLDQDRSNFFGGALERNDNMDFKDKWKQSGGNEWENRSRSEMMGMRDMNRKIREDINRDIKGSSFFNTSLGSSSNILSSLQLPSTLDSHQDVPHNNMGSDLWHTISSQGPMGYTYEFGNTFLESDSAVVRPFISAFDPPPPNATKPTTSEKPDGCHTIFIGGLPESITEDIITEVFYTCGAIQSIRISTGKSGKNFCHVRFVDPQSVDMALRYSGYRLTINNGGQITAGRIHVDYAKSREDEKEYERLLRAKAREVRHLSEMEDQRVIFSERAAADLMKSIRSDSGFFEAFGTLEQWLERGECTRKNSSTFYNLLSSVHSHVRRLIKEKREHEEIVERQKQEQLQRVKLIMSQGKSILKVFSAASKKKCWDHFSKAQRRNVGEWHQQVEKAIKISAEEQMENRVEVGMDIDEDIDQIQSTSESSQQEDENSGEPDAKQPKLEEHSASEYEKTEVEASQDTVEGNGQASLDVASPASLNAKDMKFRAQAAGLKALAQKNTSLMWQVEGYKNEILLLKQKFARVFQEKDLQIARLMTAVQALQNFLQHNHDSNAIMASGIKIEVTKEQFDPNTENAQGPAEGFFPELNCSDNESTEMVDAETTEEEKPETGEENEEDCKKTKSKDTEENGAIEGKSDVQQNDVDKTDENKAAVDCVEKEVKTSGNEIKTTDVSDDRYDLKNNSSGEEISQVPEETARITNTDCTSDECPGTEVFRLSANQMVVVGFLCSYLQICPYGATTDQVLAHIRRQVPSINYEDLEKILNGLPMLFTGDGLTFMSKTWKFNVYNM